MLGEVLIEIAKHSFQFIQKLAKENQKKILIDQKNIEEALNQHLIKVNAFSSEVSFKELLKPKRLSDVYINLDISLNASTLQGGKEISLSSSGSVNASKVVETVFNTSTNNVIIKGVPGAGKTTTLKHIIQKLLTDELFLNNFSRFPLLIRLREDDLLNNKNIPIFEYILNVFGIKVRNTEQFSTEEEIQHQLNAFKQIAAIKLLNEFVPLLILDGLDEVSSELIKDKIVKNVKEISLSANNSRFILTTRKGEDTFHIENTQVFELAPLNESQIHEYAFQWLGPTNAEAFLNQIKSSSVYDSSRRPLTLSHLCAIFEREGKIPDRSRLIYNKIVNLLIWEWDLENSVNRVTKFSHFEPDRKKEFLQNIAYELSVNFGKSQFSTGDLEVCYRNIYEKFSLGIFEMREVIREIQIHNGLIIQISYDNYEFAHKSFQEYLAAEYIVRLPKLVLKNQMMKVPSEMALAVNLSSEPSEYLAHFIHEYIRNECEDVHFLLSFCNRIYMENPDFIESRDLGLNILRIFNYHIEKSKQSGNTEHDTTHQLVVLNKAFILLLEFENIFLSVKTLIKNEEVLGVESINSLVRISFHKKPALEYEEKEFFLTQNFYSTLKIS